MLVTCYFPPGISTVYLLPVENFHFVNTSYRLLSFELFTYLRDTFIILHSRQKCFPVTFSTDVYFPIGVALVILISPVKG